MDTRVMVQELEKQVKRLEEEKAGLIKLTGELEEKLKKASEKLKKISDDLENYQLAMESLKMIRMPGVVEGIAHQEPEFDMPQRKDIPQKNPNPTGVAPVEMPKPGIKADGQEKPRNQRRGRGGKTKPIPILMMDSNKIIGKMFPSVSKCCQENSRFTPASLKAMIENVSIDEQIRIYGCAFRYAQE